MGFGLGLKLVQKRTKAYCSSSQGPRQQHGRRAKPDKQRIVDVKQPGKRDGNKDLKKLLCVAILESREASWWGR